MQTCQAEHVTPGLLLHSEQAVMTGTVQVKQQLLEHTYQ